MNYTDKDLERLLELLLSASRPTRINPQELNDVYRVAVAGLNAAKAADVGEFYRTLSPRSWFVEAFQMSTQRGGSIDTEKTDWNSVRDTVNLIFGTDFSQYTRMDNKTYLWLRPQGTLESHGSCHRDGVARMNMHYFVVNAAYDALSRVVDTFVSNHRNLAVFAKTVFGWKNHVDEGRWGQADLFAHMKELHVHTPEHGYRKVVVGQ